jgi:predicted transcriptional regulator
MVINIKDELHKRLKKYAVKTDQQLQNVANLAIKEFLDNNEKKESLV